MNSAEARERAVPSGLTRRTLLIILIMVPLSFLVNFWIQTLTTWWAFPGWLPPTYILILMIIELIRRSKPEWGLTPQEHAVLITAFLMCLGITYVQYGQPLWGISCVPTYSFFMPIYVLNTEAYKAWWNWIPSYWAPTDRAVLEKAWLGLKPGESIPWGAWIGPILYWTIFFLAWTYFSYFLGFMMRKPMVEIEKLPFPAVLPTAYMMQWYCETDPETKRSKLFSLKYPRSRLFWVGFIIGFILTFPDVVRYFLPKVPASTEWSTHPVDFSSIMVKVLPGAFAFAYLMIPEIPVFMLCTNDVLITCVLTYIIFAVLYPGLGVKLGILEYVPGAESMKMGIMAGYYGRHGPFKYWYFAAYGLPIAIGLWFLYLYGKHFLTFFKALRGPDEYEQGVSKRFVAIGLIATWLLLLGYFVGSGAPFIVALVLLIIYPIYEIANIRLSGELWRHFTVFSELGSPLAWYTGVAIGAWPDVTPTSSMAAFRTEFMVWALGNAGPRLSPFNARTSIVAYKLADMLNTSARDILFTMLITALIAGFSAHFISVWWIHHLGGLANLGPVPYHEWAVSGASTYTLNPSELNFREVIGLTVFGIVLTFILYMLRARYPWFIWNPIAMMVTLFVMEWVWLNALIALILKYIIIRVGGVKLYEEKAIPIMVGFLMGWGFNYFIVATLQFFCRAVPAFSARFV